MCYSHIGNWGRGLYIQEYVSENVGWNHQHDPDMIIWYQNSSPKVHTASHKRIVFGFPKNRLRSSSDIWRISRPLRTWLKNIICQWFFGNSGASNKRKWYDMVPAGLFIVYNRVNVVSCFFGWPGKRWVVTEELCIVLMGSLPLNTLWDASPKHLRDHLYKMCKSLKVDQPSLTSSNQFHCVMRDVQIFESRVCRKKQMFSMFPPGSFLYLWPFCMTDTTSRLYPLFLEVNSNFADKSCHEFPRLAGHVNLGYHFAPGCH